MHYGGRMIAQELEDSLHMAFVEARQQRHEFITVEHLLMALLDNPSAAEVLRACSANADDLRKSLLGFIKENTPTVGGTDEVDTQPTLGFQRVIQRAIMHVQSTGSGKKEVTGANVLVAIFGEKDSHAVYYLHQQGVTRLDVVNFIAHGIKKSEPPEPMKSNEGSAAETEKEEGDGKGSPLDQFTQNLNQLARDGKIDPLIGRELEVERVIQVLCRRRKNNPLLVGEAGVGKTAIAEGLAWRITQNEGPEGLAESMGYTLDMGALPARTKYPGDFAQRLKGLKSRFEDHHQVKYALNALQAAAELSAKFINDRHLPDKAIDVIDEAGAAQRILPKNKQKKTITRSEVEEIVAKIARIPPASVSSDDRGKLKSLDRDLKSVVFGQEPAIEALASAIKMARSGLGRPDKPIGSFLFSGPTGVGKTEVARQLAFILGIELIRFDMSEYMERHAVSRLIGAPPGYVGFDQGGLLTEAISKKPHAVLLLDEIEKAHPDVFNVLLQVMDHGTLTDNNGRKADFRNVIIVMTTNAGAETMNKATIGFTNAREQGDEMADIKALFTPESRNRLDAVVSFRSLDEEIILRVVDKFLLQLESQLTEKKLEVTFTDALRKHLAKKGFDPLMGARPMQRLIQDTIRRSLADELLFGQLVDGGRLEVDWVADADDADKGEVKLDITPQPKQDPASEPAEPKEATAD